MSFKIPSVPKSHNPTIPKSHNPRIPPDARLGVQKPEPALTQPHPLQLNPSRAPFFHFPLPDKNLQRPQNHSRRRECGVFPPPSQRSPWKCREAPNPAGASSLHVLWCLPRPRGFWDPPLVSLFFFFQTRSCSLYIRSLPELLLLLPGIFPGWNDGDEIRPSAGGIRRR